MDLGTHGSPHGSYQWGVAHLCQIHSNDFLEITYSGSGLRGKVGNCIVSKVALLPLQTTMVDIIHLTRQVVQMDHKQAAAVHDCDVP